MATLAEIRAGLATNLSTIAGCQISGYMLSAPTPPCLYVVPGDIEFDQAMQRGMDRWTFRVVALAGLASDIGAQKKLDEFLAPSGATSVKAAVEADRTLGGVVDDLRVTAATGYRTYGQPGGQVHLGVEFTVDVIE